MEEHCGLADDREKGDGRGQSTLDHSELVEAWAMESSSAARF